jgi:histidine triad (HIT) family protein
MKMGECKHCELLKEKKHLIYEDNNVLALVPERQAIAGHVQVMPKKHHKKMQDIEDKELEHAFYAASFAASALFEGFEAHGTNIMANTGSQLKEGGHFHIDVLARRQGDDLNLIWKPNKLPEEEMDEVHKKIKDKCDLIGKKKQKEIIDLDKKNVEKIGIEESKKNKEPTDDNKENKKEAKEDKKEDKRQYPDEDRESYLIKQLKRMP